MNYGWTISIYGRPSQLCTQLEQFQKRKPEKNQPWTRFKPMTSVIPVQLSTTEVATQVGAGHFAIVTSSNQLPVVLIAHLVEHCIGIVEVMGSNHVQLPFNWAWLFFSLYLRNCFVYITAMVFHVIMCSLCWKIIAQRKKLQDVGFSRI